MNEIFLDTETTGLSFNEGHKVVEIACVETKDLIPTNNVFHKLINPKRNVPEEAIKIHGFSEEFLKTKETFSEIADDFLSFIDGKKIIIHNANFDLGFLNGELAAANKKQINKNMVIDSLDIARNKFPGTSNSLDALCKRFNIDLSRRTKHNALLDCELLREAYINLLDVNEPKLHLSSSSDSIDKFSNFKDSYSKKVIKISELDIEKHKKFLKTEIKKNYY
jgi:DNA polymerase-3 subunit epsilon